MKNLIHRLAIEDAGNVHLLYALALLLVAIISQPSVALALFYQAEDLIRMFVGQLASIV